MDPDFKSYRYYHEQANHSVKEYLTSFGCLGIDFQRQYLQGDSNLEHGRNYDKAKSEKSEVSDTATDFNSVFLYCLVKVNFPICLQIN